MLNQCRDLLRAQQQTLLREAGQQELAVVGGVVSGGQPAHHVGAAQRRERQQQHKLRPRFPRQLHRHVIRPHRHGAVAVDFLRNGPHIVAVVKGAYIGDVVTQQPLGLHLELALGHLNMGQQLRRHRGERFEQVGEGSLPGAQHRIGGIAHVEPHMPVVGIHHSLHRVTEVANTAGVGIGVGIAAAHREAIEEPILVMLVLKTRRVVHPGGNQIGLALEAQERCQGRESLIHLTAHQQP